jgi:hypothetical protein
MIIGKPKRIPALLIRYTISGKGTVFAKKLQDLAGRYRMAEKVRDCREGKGFAHKIQTLLRRYRICQEGTAFVEKLQDCQEGTLLHCSECIGFAQKGQALLRRYRI